MSMVSRPRRTALLVCGLALVASAGCAGSSAKTPTVASVNFEPKVELHVGDSGPLELSGIDEARPGLPVGTVVVISNDGSNDHRIQGTTGATILFDTGTLRPGDRTTVVTSSLGPLAVHDLPTGRVLAFPFAGQA